MKFRLNMILPTLFVLALATCPAAGQDHPNNTPEGYDAKLAEELGADEYGMRSYVLVVLKTGPADITDEARRSEIFRGHFSNMKRLADLQKLVLAGPFMNGGDKRGLYIFNVKEIADAEALVETDPAVAAGIFIAEYTQYYGTAALMGIQAVHQQIQKTKIE